MRIGFTGTQHGMTPQQKETFKRVIALGTAMTEFHHGDCEGADTDAHRIVIEMNQPGIKPTMVIHPPSDPKLRVWCNEIFGGVCEVREEKPYLDRNMDIVQESELLIATPSSFLEQRRSGTWSTVRYARMNQVPRHIIWPDGMMQEEK